MSSSLAVAAVVSFYMCAALVMVFVNKAVLISTPSLPLLFLLFQLLIAVILLHVSALFSKRIELPSPSIAAFKPLVPVVLVNVVGLVFNTLCLRDVEASFFQIARGMQLPLTILVSVITVRPLLRPSNRVIGAAAIVTLGFFLGVTPASAAFNLSYSNLAASGAVPLKSLFYGFLSSLFIAIHAVLIKSSLPHCNNSTIHLAWWTNAGSALFLAPFVILTGEIGTLRELIATQTMNGQPWSAHTFVYGSLVTGFFGFLLCIAGLLSIKVTSPITHMFSSAARSVLQTLLGVWIFSDLLTVNRAASILVILGGTMFYTWVKHIEGQKPAQKDTPLPKYAPVPTSAPEDKSAHLPSASGSQRRDDDDDDDDMTLEELEKEILGTEGGKRRDNVV